MGQNCHRRYDSNMPILHQINCLLDYLDWGQQVYSVLQHQLGFRCVHNLFRDVNPCIVNEKVNSFISFSEQTYKLCHLLLVSEVAVLEFAYRS